MASMGDLPPNLFLQQQMNDRELHRFIDKNLQPTEEFNRKCNEKMDKLAEFLRTDREFSVSEVFKGGSLKKGTAIEGQADLDAVVFLNDFRPLRDVSDYKGQLQGILRQLERNVSASAALRAEVEYRTQYSLKMKLSSDGGDYLGVDILPAPATNNAKTLDKLRSIFNEMDGQCEDARAFYSSSLSPWQVKFVHDKIGHWPNVKNLVRLVKYWKKTHLPESIGHHRSLPTSYVFELLAISRWERAGQPEQFSVKQLFKDVMTQLANPGNINAEWRDYYNRNNYMHACQKETGKPFILDPANPFNNVCATFDGGAWNEVEQMARRSLASPLLQ